MEIGGGRAERRLECWNLVLPATLHGYANAQFDDYHTLPRSQFLWSPPMRLTLRARVSTPAPRGTYGFGFWNDPFALPLGQSGAARRFPAAPNCLWFFCGTPPHDLALVPGLDGWGWKAQMLRSPFLPGLVLLPMAAGAMLLSRIPGLRGPIVRAARRAACVSEGHIQAAASDWHSYAIDWRLNGAAFHVDGALILETSIGPRPPLGFVAWIDNQFAVVSPHKAIRFGVMPTDEEVSLEIRDLKIESCRG